MSAARPPSSYSDHHTPLTVTIGLTHLHSQMWRPTPPRCGDPRLTPSDAEVRGGRQHPKGVQDLLQDAVEGTEPRLVFHGHWHERNHERIRRRKTEVFGLAHDGRPGCFAVLDLGDLRGAYYTRSGG